MKVHVWVALLGVAAHSIAADPLFEDMSANLPVHVYDGGWEHFVGGGVAVFDCNDDALPDIFAAGGESPTKLIRNNGNFEFVEISGPLITGATGAYPINIDGDDHIDLFVLRVGANVVLIGKGDCEFEDASERLGISDNDQWSTAFSAWWDGEMGPFLAVGNYVDRTDPDGPFKACDDNEILSPGANRYTSNTLTPGYCPLSMLAARNAAGQPTLRISNDRHYYVSGGHEQMWNLADQRYLDESDGWDTVSLWGMGIASRDLNADGRDEVMLTSMGDQLLQIAQGDGSYAAAPYEIGTYAQRPHIGDDGRPSTGWHAQFGDVDNDGLADLFIAKGNVDQMPGMAMGDPNNLLMQRPDGTFEETAATAGVATLDRSRGAALVDFDGDGRLDLLVSNRRAPLELYRNVTAETGNWITIDLHQSTSNRDAVGAIMTVIAGPLTQVFEVTIGGGHASGQLVPYHFGLGDENSAEVRVQWPNGSVTTTTASAGQAINIVKP